MLHEIFYKSLAHHLTSNLPAAVTVVDGALYGTGQIEQTSVPYVSVSLVDTMNDSVELGSDSIRFEVALYISAGSKKQRDAVKQALYDALMHRTFHMYTVFTNNDPVITSPRREAQVGDFLRMIDTPFFETGVKRSLWDSTLYTYFVVI